MALSHDVAVVVLAGGDSVRFGTNKLLEEVGGVPMLKRVINVGHSVSPAVFLSVKPADDLVDSMGGFSVPIIPDVVAGIGPLAGLYSAFLKLEQDWILLLAGDMPLINAESLHRLLDARGEGVDAVVAKDPSGRVHPLAACYQASVLPSVEARMHDRAYSMRGLISVLKNVKYVTLPLEVVRNVNRPEDMEIDPSE